MPMTCANSDIERSRVADYDGPTTDDLDLHITQTTNDVLNVIANSHFNSEFNGMGALPIAEIADGLDDIISDVYWDVRQRLEEKQGWS